ncbi:MAG TPA: hypothetical protein VGM15_09760 [Burkholderiaceae bacterium]
MKTKLAWGLSTFAAALITCGTALAQQSNPPGPATAESAEGGTGDPNTGYSSRRDPTHRGGQRLPAPDPVQPVAAGNAPEPAKVDARHAKGTDATSSDNSRYDDYKDLAPFGE